MIEKLAFIDALAAAVIAIAAEGWASWSTAHSGDTYFKMINARLLVLMKHYNQASIDDLCDYLVAEDLVPAPQSVPSEFFWPYKLAACFSSPRAVIRKRVPAHVVKPNSGALIGAPGSHRWGTWEVFKKAIECLWNQPETGGEDDKLDGPMGRDKWFTQSAGSGLFWLNYFMQNTLDYMYGPGKPNIWPFDFKCPPWCVTQHYQWKLHAYGVEGYAALNIFYFPPPGSSYGSGVTIHMRIKPDPSLGDPGNMDVGYLHSSHASSNTDYEVWGEYTESDLSPLPANWTAWALTCTQYANDPWLYQYLEFLLMDGDYIIDLFVSSAFNFDEPAGIYYETLGGDWY